MQRPVLLKSPSPPPPPPISPSLNPRRPAAAPRRRPQSRPSGGLMPPRPADGAFSESRHRRDGPRVPPGEGVYPGPVSRGRSPTQLAAPPPAGRPPAWQFRARPAPHPPPPPLAAAAPHPSPPLPAPPMRRWRRPPPRPRVRSASNPRPRSIRAAEASLPLCRPCSPQSTVFCITGTQAARGSGFLVRQATGPQTRARPTRDHPQIGARTCLCGSQGCTA